MKQAVIAPSMMWRLYPLKDDVMGYTREEFERDLLDAAETHIRRAF